MDQLRRDGDVEPAGRPDTFALTDIQQAYWVGQDPALELSIPARYYVEVELPDRMAGGVSDALNLLVRRHAMLRAVLLSSGDQRILEQVPEYHVECRDLRGLSSNAHEAGLTDLREEMQSKNLPGEVWPQFDCRISRGDAGSRLHLRFALWLLDGWSFICSCANCWRSARIRKRHCLISGCGSPTMSKRFRMHGGPTAGVGVGITGGLGSTIFRLRRRCRRLLAG